MKQKNIDFKEEVVKKIKELPTQKDQRFFAWLCAVRSLPFLSAKRHFSYWEKDKKQIYLQSIFYILDIAYAVSFDPTVPVTRDTHNISNVATRNAHGVVDIAAQVVSCAAYAITGTATIYTAYAVAGTAAFNTVTAATHYTADLRRVIQEIITNDIEAILAGKYSEFHNDTSMYGTLWDDFQDDLTAIGCKYWADLYADMFKNRFQFDDEALEALNRRINVPAEVRKIGAAAVSDYLENAERQGLAYVQRETRLIILGSAGAGKTTLTKRLNGELDYPALEDSTHGVDTKVKLDFNGIKTHVWDFGGQVIYHASHRCFLSENCVYILVVNARTEDNRDATRINYWLDTMRVYSDGKAKVFIIINEPDNRKQNVDDYNSFKDGEYGELIQEIFSFNIGKDMDSVNKFKKILANYIESTGHQTFGKNDSRVIEQIQALFEQKMQILKAEELRKILRENGIKTRNDQRRAKELFNILGIALSYDFMDSCILDPYWISHGIYKVIDYLQKNKSTFINYSNLDAVFADESGTYPKGKYEYILELMKLYRIGFSNKDGIRGLIIPCVAAQFMPKDIIMDASPDNIMTQVEREDLQEFPADFFYRFICANEVDIKINDEKWAVWQTGMVLAEKRASALVELKENRRIEITVWGQGKEEYRKKLESLIDSLLKEYRFTSYIEEREKGGRHVNFISLALSNLIIDAITGREINMTNIENQYNITDSTVIRGDNNKLAVKSDGAIVGSKTKQVLPSSVDDESFTQLLSVLENFLKSEEADELKRKDLRAIETEIDEANMVGHKNGWERLHNFLSDAANTVTIVSPIGAYLASHPEVPQKITSLFNSFLK